MITSKKPPQGLFESTHPPSRKSVSNESITQRRKSGTSQNDYNTDVDETSRITFQSLDRKLSRTSMLLLDYRQFKAARTIQAAVRGWMVRRKLRRKRCAAIIIQRDWRRFSAMRGYYRLLEDKVQTTIEAYHTKAAVKIQANWRGFLVREHIHNQYRMKRSQRMAAEELLHCIALKLHYLLRTYQIPGIYSMRNSHALSKVEKLLVSISFKQGNNRTHLQRLQREANLQHPRKYFEQNAVGTKVPYAGPNFSGLCEPRCDDIYKEPDMDSRMHQILRKYEEEQFNNSLKCRSKKKKNGFKRREPTISDTFCSDVVESMHRWNIVAPNKFEVKKDIFRNPENVADFLTEIESMYNFMKGSCACPAVDPTNYPPKCAKRNNV